MPVDRLEIRGRRRHLHEIAGRVVVGARAADAEIRPVAAIKASAWGTIWPGGGGDRRGDLVGQAVALVGVEDGEALEERDRARLFAGLRGAPRSSSGHETIRVNDNGTALAFPDVAAETERLTECEPALAREAAFDHCTPSGSAR